MGLGISTAMEKNFEKQKRFTLEMQKAQVERQIHMQNIFRQRQMAMQIASSRDLLMWVGAFYIVAAPAMIATYRKTRNKAVLAPLFPLSLYVLYQADFAYGSKVSRIRREAESILQFEPQITDMPFGTPSLSLIDQSRSRVTDEQRLRTVHDVYL